MTELAPGFNLERQGQKQKSKELLNPEPAAANPYSAVAK
jgi:hypothetical protein